MLFLGVLALGMDATDFAIVAYEIGVSLQRQATYGM
jgi:hypothetical protein